ncbi:unnamed protein product [Menidia menidia]|uniref:(Atlantic silverside) hypothetical protein n=1 Tax=Menidia menidia TaxID=238744 RepID=A0A8S4BPD6_9TELE|nr:unnamed protein product [Menidia menidia]
MRQNNNKNMLGRLSAAGGQKMEELIAVVGGNITLTDSILQRGFLLFKGSNIASLRKGEFDIEDKTYENRVHWNKQTGLFTITDLQKNDSGLYKLESKTESVFSSYQLRVFGLEATQLREELKSRVSTGRSREEAELLWVRTCWPLCHHRLVFLPTQHSSQQPSELLFSRRTAGAGTRSGGESITAGHKTEELRVVGGNITLPDSVLQNGFLSINGRIIALVRKGEFGIEDHSYVDKVHWNKQTGLFTITDLQISDSGDYNINFDMGPVYSFSLRVFALSCDL